MNDGDNNDEPRPVRGAIESLDDYIRRHGLPANDGDDEAGGEFNGLNRLEAIDRIRAEEAYLDGVIERHQAQHEVPPREGANAASPLDEGHERAVISVLLADETSHSMPMKPLVESCETVRRMVDSRQRYGVRYGVAEGGGGGGGNEIDNGERGSDSDKAMDEAKQSQLKDSAQHADLETSPTCHEDKAAPGPHLELSLVEFDSVAVVQFMDLITSLHALQEKEGTNASGSTLTSRKRRMNDDLDEVANDNVMALIDEGKIADHLVVECLKISHYLQCRAVLEALATVLELSIDSHNCMAICSLADALSLRKLFEASVNHVIRSLDALQGTASEHSEGGTDGSRASSSLSSDDDDGGSETMEEVWASLPHELRSRVLTMRNAMRSSVIGKGSKVSGLFFSSGNEFLAIFRETIRDQKERLAEAKERREEVIRERQEEWRIICQRRGRWFDASSEAQEGFIYGPDVTYAAGKIEKQTRRLATLETFYAEQCTIFKGGGLAGEIRL